jgi:hypothetical protein
MLDQDRYPENLHAAAEKFRVSGAHPYLVYITAIIGSYPNAVKSLLGACQPFGSPRRRFLSEVFLEAPQELPTSPRHSMYDS